MSAQLGAIYGGEQTGRDGGETGLLDAIVKFNPSDRLGFWINGDYAFNDSFGKNGWGVAAAGRFGITDRTGIALRGEYVQFDRNPAGFCGTSDSVVSSAECSGISPSFLENSDTDIWGLTATLDHLLTDNLMIRAEARYDHVNKDDTDDEEFLEDSSDLDDDQIVLGAEVIYNFNKFGGE